MSDFPPTQAQPQNPSEPGAFPPQELGEFLRFCAGEWMSLRSQLQLGLTNEDQAEGGTDEAATTAEAAADLGSEESWHSSERGELVMRYVEGDGPGGLEVAPKRDGALQPATQLLFTADGRFSSSGSANGSDREGSWTLWPDGSLELVLEADGVEVREKIWFTKPNLRLRSTIENRPDGSPGRASFSSEIRRVSRPPA